MTSPTAKFRWPEATERKVIGICTNPDCLAGASRLRKRWECPNCNQPYRYLRDPIPERMFDKLSRAQREDLVLAKQKPAKVAMEGVLS